MPVRDTGERPWFCNKPGCHKDIWIGPREHAKFHQKTCTLRFPNEAPLRIERDVGAMQGWLCPKCNGFFAGTPHGVRALHAHAKSGECLRASPMADLEAADVEPTPQPEMLEGLSHATDDPGREVGRDDLAGSRRPNTPPGLDDILDDWKDTDEDIPMDIAVDLPAEEDMMVAMELDEKLNIMEENAAAATKRGTSRAHSTSPKESEIPLSTEDKKVPKDEFTGRCVPTKPPLITLDTFLDGLRLSGDRPTVVAKLRDVFETHGFSTPPKLDALFRNPPDFTNTRADTTMRDYEKTVALDIVEQVSLGAWLAVRAGIVARAKELGVDSERL